MTTPTTQPHEKYDRLIAVARKHPPMITAVAHPCDGDQLEKVHQDRGGYPAHGDLRGDFTEQIFTGGRGREDQFEEAGLAALVEELG